MYPHETRLYWTCGFVFAPKHLSSRIPFFRGALHLISTDLLQRKVNWYKAKMEVKKTEEKCLLQHKKKERVCEREITLPRTSYARSFESWCV